MSSAAIPKVVPAQLSFLAIYNPALGTSDETFKDQVVFYYSKAAKVRSKTDGSDAQAEQDLREQENEKLRQVGLAQGLVGFARSFSHGEPVDSAETHKSRIVLHEMEKGWWVLASIDLTQLPATTNGAPTETAGDDHSEPAIDYSSREVSPPALLLQQLKRAYSIFLLHHGSTFDDLFARLDRPRFCGTLERYWTRFASDWDVLLHGSPAVDIFGGLKLAAGGELGMGVGEEEWGSGEREVLEDFARRTDGLVDVVVCRFGEPSPLQLRKSAADLHVPTDFSDLEPWIGRGKRVGASDGVVFSGIGALSRKSLRDISHWVETIYAYGDQAYGVRDNPTADRRKRRKRDLKPPVSEPDSSETTREQTRLRDMPPGIPPPIVSAVESSLDKASNAVESGKTTQGKRSDPLMASLGDSETWMKYLTLGYGTAWGGTRPQSSDEQPQPLTSSNKEREPSPDVPMRWVEPEPDVDRAEQKLKYQIQHENAGYFIIGLKGGMQNDDRDDENEEGAWNNRILLRTVHVESVTQLPQTPTEDDMPDYEKELSLRSLSAPKFSRLRPVVYVHRPFIYTFLFNHRTESLSFATFYRDLHTYFSPLHRPLSNSTSPDKVAARLSAASSPFTTTSSTTNTVANTQPIYDLVYDPRTLTIHSSLPNIPDPGTLIAEGLDSTAMLSGWSRVEALNVHSQILATVSGTRRILSEIEQTCKTSRGWWVVWMRLPPSSVDPPTESTTSQADPEFKLEDLREAFLVRRARDPTVSSTKSSGGRWGSAMWRLGGPSTGEKMGGAAAGWGPKGLSEGIGIDARRYIEGLLSLNR